VHKTANVLNKVALSVQVNMKVDLREICGAPTRAGREALLAFFDFPAEHWALRENGNRPRAANSFEQTVHGSLRGEDSSKFDGV
jgi:hypothetical protein